MTSNTESLNSAAAPIWRTIAAVAELGFARIRKFVLGIRHRRDIEVLAGFDDRMLSDIGLNRSDVRFALAEPFWRDPGSVLTARAGERRAARRSRPAASPGREVAAPSIVPEDSVKARTVARC